MRSLTGQEVLAIAVTRLAGGGQAEAVRILGLREMRPGVERLADQVGRWVRGEAATPADVALRALDALGAINWDVLYPPESQAEVQSALDSAKHRTAELQDLLDGFSKPPSANPGTP